MSGVLLVITAYNCERHIKDVLEKTQKYAGKYVRETIVLNGNSADNTRKKVEQYLEQHSKQPVKLINNNRHSGLGTAMKWAIMYAKRNHFSYLLHLRGDGQIDIRQFLPVLKKKRYEKWDGIMGARFMLGSHAYHYSFPRIVSNHFLNILYSICLKKRIFDLGSGIGIYKVDRIAGGNYDKLPENNLFFAVLLLEYCYDRRAFAFYPISIYESEMDVPVKRINQSVFLMRWLVRFWLKPESIKGDYRAVFQR